MKTWSLMMMQIALISFTVSANAKEVNPMMKMTSPAFENQGAIPGKYTCDGEDISPALAWSNVPEGTKSFALIVDDPDAPDPANPRMTWVHWVVYNIPATMTSVPEGVKEKDLAKGTLPGLNDWKKTGYDRPCPPIGKHRYFHKLYALDIVLPDLKQTHQGKTGKSDGGPHPFQGGTGRAVPAEKMSASGGSGQVLDGLKLLDCHAHLEEVADPEAAIERAGRSGVRSIVAVGSDLETNRRILSLSGRHGDVTVHAALGIHTPGA